jgi:tagatose-1,6-bisphosphate aldolase non-catalytic subunit AgaZ/GatZ
MTQQEKQAVEKAAQKYSIKMWESGRKFGSVKQYSKEDFIAGAEKLAELRNAEKPSEELVKEIYDLIEKYHYDEYAIWSVEDSMRCSTEIANIVTKREAELLEAAKDALTTFYGIGCTDEADIVQALKKAISKY